MRGGLPAGRRPGDDQWIVDPSKPLRSSELGSGPESVSESVICSPASIRGNLQTATSRDTSGCGRSTVPESSCACGASLSAGSSPSFASGMVPSYPAPAPATTEEPGGILTKTVNPSAPSPLSFWPLFETVRGYDVLSPRRSPRGSEQA